MRALFDHGHNIGDNLSGIAIRRNEWTNFIGIDPIVELKSNTDDEIHPVALVSFVRLPREAFAIVYLRRASGESRVRLDRQWLTIACLRANRVFVIRLEERSARLISLRFKSRSAQGDVKIHHLFDFASSHTKMAFIIHVRQWTGYEAKNRKDANRYVDLDVYATLEAMS